MSKGEKTKAPTNQPRGFYKKRAAELTQTVLKLDAQVKELESKFDLQAQRTFQAEKDLAGCYKRHERITVWAGGLLLGVGMIIAVSLLIHWIF